ncbi:hypothetical protein EVAR_12920_1 [Eumeta japonica]|uniref:Uncharacterized protein n=1 Tax=Eumeta variegata TaxID=151549 RepID=A0A4C1TVU4_EUMVA|nr:hypothetical protein EVAR_12920_1 [Eumeta japonica]
MNVDVVSAFGPARRFCQRRVSRGVSSPATRVHCSRPLHVAGWGERTEVSGVVPFAIRFQLPVRSPVRGSGERDIDPAHLASRQIFDDSVSLEGVESRSQQLKETTRRTGQMMLHYGGTSQLKVCNGTDHPRDVGEVPSGPRFAAWLRSIFSSAERTIAHGQSGLVPFPAPPAAQRREPIGDGTSAFLRGVGRARPRLDEHHFTSAANAALRTSHSHTTPKIRTPALAKRQLYDCIPISDGSASVDKDIRKIYNTNEWKSSTGTHLVVVVGGSARARAAGPQRPPQRVAQQSQVQTHRAPEHHAPRAEIPPSLNLAAAAAASSALARHQRGENTQTLIYRPPHARAPHAAPPRALADNREHKHTT